MIKFNNANVGVVADNRVVLCDIEYMLTDDEVLKVKSIIDGLISSRNNSAVSSTGTMYKASGITEVPEKKVYRATKPFTPKYQIKELTGTDGTTLWCISRENGWTRAEKSLMNSAIKALKGIKEIEVAGVRKDKDGNEKQITFKAWGYNTQATAKKHLSELPTEFSVEQLNGEVQA